MNETASTAGSGGVTLPSWAAHLEQKLAPGPLLLVQAFVDTLDLDLGTDILAQPDQARAWLADAGLRDGVAPPGDARDPGFADDLQLAREVRETFRAMIARNTGGGPLTAAELKPIAHVLAQAQPELAVSAQGEVTLAAQSPAEGVAEGLLGLLLSIRDAQADGSWSRLKLCGNPDCRWAFYDRSHGQVGAWCDMATCGNRIKNRRLRQRPR